MGKLPQVSVAKVPDLVERENGLYEFHGESVQDHVDVFLVVDGGVESAKWAMAAIAASLTTKYGDSDVEEFAKLVKRTPQHIWKMARTHRAVADSKVTLKRELTFSHHAEAIRHPDPEEALAVAADNGFSSMGLSEWISEQARLAKPKTQRKRQNDFRDFLERVDQLILSDFMVTCPNAEWGRRVFKSWREDVTWELSQISRTEAKDKVLDAIEDGADTIQDIKLKTGLPTKDIEMIVDGLVKQNIFEWVREGGETEASRGVRRSILHKVGTPCFV